MKRGLIKLIMSTLIFGITACGLFNGITGDGETAIPTSIWMEVPASLEGDSNTTRGIDDRGPAYYHIVNYITGSKQLISYVELFIQGFAQYQDFFIATKGNIVDLSSYGGTGWI